MDRLNLLRESLKRTGMSAFALTAGSSFRWLAGHSIGEGDRLFLVLIPAQGTPAAVLPSLELSNWKACVSFEARLFPWEDNQGPDKAVDAALSGLGPLERLAIEPGVMRVQEYEALRRHLPGARFEDAATIVIPLRLHKGREEADAVRRAARIAEEALEETLRTVRVGVSEREVAGRLAGLLLAKGGEGISFGPIVLSGPKSALPHGVPDERAVRAGELLLIDFGTSWKGFHCDITRTFVVGALPDDQTRWVYETVREGNAKGVAAARPGATAHDVHHAAQDGFAAPEFAQYFKHRTGHGLGLDIHEAPSIMDGNRHVLEPGMLFTVEPGLYLEGWGGVRIEDDIWITSSGSESLTRFPRDLRVLAG